MVGFLQILSCETFVSSPELCWVLSTLRLRPRVSFYGVLKPGQFEKKFVGGIRTYVQTYLCHRVSMVKIILE